MARMSPARFIESVISQVRGGWEFVPFIGGGMSAVSGIPTGLQIGDYLNACIVHALRGGRKYPPAWTPRAYSWPRRTELSDLSKDIQTLLEENARQTACLLRKDHQSGLLRLEALGAMSNWRTALHFLSRLELLDGQPSLGAPDDRVVDAFFNHVTRGRYPNDAHMLLAQLADALGVHTILTTNFDDLIEQAFVRSSRPLAAFDVHLKAGLPDAKLVLAKRSIVKLHGGRYGLRADFSLEETPSQRDTDTLRSYLEPGNRHIIALGSSCGDKRIRAMLAQAMAANSRMRLWWICHKKQEEDGILARFRDESIGDVAEAINVTTSQDLTLFLYELSQRLCLSLPPPGARCPAFWRVPPLPFQKPDEQPFCDQRKHLAEKITKTVSGMGGRGSVIELVGGRGLSSVAADAFQKLSEDHLCLWLETDDFGAPDELFLTLADLVARMVGMGMSMPLIVADDTESYEQSLLRCLDECTSAALRPVIVFINSRDGLGNNAGFDIGTEEKCQQWSEDQKGAFWALLDRVGECSIHFVVLCGRNGLQPRTGSVDPVLQKDSLEVTAMAVVNDICDWLLRQGDPRTWRFVYSMTLFRHSRHISALSSWAFISAPEQCRADGQDNDEVRARVAADWLSRLAAMGAVRSKPGGFAWMHSDVRNSLRSRLDRYVVPTELGAQPTLCELRAEYHQGIADWYMKLYRSSSDPLAAVESLYHRLCCAHHSKHLPTSRVGGCGDPDHVRRTAFVEAGSTLRLARQQILSEGHFKVFLRLLQQIASSDLLTGSTDSEGRALKRLCHEIMRDFAKETGDFTLALEQGNALADTWADRTPDEGSTPVAATAFGVLETVGARKSLHAALCSMGMRSYDQAEDRFHEGFRLLGLDQRLLASALKRDDISWPLLGQSVADMRTLGREWLKTTQSRQDILQILANGLRRYVFLEVLRAQVLEAIGAQDAVDKRLQYAEKIYTLATELMRSYENVDELQILNIHLRTDYAVLLAMTRRFQEADRRLNEALGYLTQSRSRQDGLIPAIIDMRRAETCLFHVQRLDPDDSRLRNQVVALLDNMNHAMEKAGHELANRRRSIWWWTYYCDLRMAACVESIAHGCCGQQQAVRTGCVPLFCSTCSALGEQCEKALSEGMGLVYADVVRQVRFTDLMARFISYAKDCSKADSARMGKALQCAREHLYRVVGRRGKLTAAFPLGQDTLAYVEQLAPSSQLRGQRKRSTAKAKGSA